MSTVKTIALEALEHNPAQLLGRPLPKPTDKNFNSWKEEFCEYENDLVNKLRGENWSKSIKAKKELEERL